MKSRILKPNGVFCSRLEQSRIVSYWRMDDGTEILKGDSLKLRGISAKVLDVSPSGLLISPRKPSGEEC
jgi:hypothetical protein